MISPPLDVIDEAIFIPPLLLESESDQMVTAPEVVVMLLLTNTSAVAFRVIELPVPFRVWLPFKVTEPPEVEKFSDPVVDQALGKVKSLAIEIVVVPEVEPVLKVVKLVK